jgi:dephospho-CoA kinase
MSNNNSRIIRIGIAGRMGAGKSTCAALLAGSRYRIIDADREAKLLMNSDASIMRRLAEVFGPSVTNGNTVYFSKLGAIAFASVEAMQMLDTIVHPPLIARLHGLVFSDNRPCILDAAIIPQWKIEQWFDLRFWVVASPSIRLARVQAKTNLPPERIKMRMSVQETILNTPVDPGWTLVKNEGTLDELQNQIERFQ